MRAPDFARGLLEALFRDRARLGLTVAGIAVGSFAVAALVSLGAAIRHAITASLEDLGENLVIVTQEAPRNGAPMSGTAARRPAGATLSLQDAIALRALPSVQAVSSIVASPCVAAIGAQSTPTTCVGVDANYLDVARILVGSGAEFTADPDKSPRAEALLGATVRRRLFGNDEAVGHFVDVAGRRTRVVGIARARGSGAGGNDEDDFILVPAAYARQQLAGRWKAGEVDALFLLARRDAGIEAAVTDVEAELARRRNLPDLRDVLSVSSLAGLMSARLQASDLLTLLMGGMAAVSLLVGGVGIVNVMLTNVAERRMEIGLKLALGAAPRLIALEFLAEAVVLAVAGALAGLAAAQLLAAALSAAQGLEVSITPGAAALALGLALGVGAIAGAWPADRAAQLDPREVLRDA